ncbi:MAG: 50S ribosomal protein L13 [Candidatus ainarchaeum sp.]|nr:50S ribosomal protein L13 [Candidatus ainarchaeum sp.]
MIINAEGLVAGRLASKIAKKAINKETITIINAEKAIIVGTRNSIMPKFEQRVNASVKSNPHYGPKYDRIPSKMLRKIIKGMLPRRKKTAEKIIKQITIYNSIPKNINLEKMEIIENVKCNEKHDFMYLKEIAELLGGKW